MKLTLQFINEDYLVEVRDKEIVGVLVMHFINWLRDQEPKLIILEADKGWQLWCSGYLLDMNQNFKDQERNFDSDAKFKLYTNIYADPDSLKAIDYKNIVSESISIDLLPNQYTPYLKVIRKGPDHFIAMLISSNLGSLIDQKYTKNNFALLKQEYDLHGLFTHKIFRTSYNSDDKSCLEDPVSCINSLCQASLDGREYSFKIKYAFSNLEGNNIGEFTVDDKRSYSLSQNEREDLFRRGEPLFTVSIMCQGQPVEESMGYLINTMSKKIQMMNDLLTKLNINLGWFEIYNGNCLLIEKENLQILKESNLIPVEPEFYNAIEI